MRMKGLETLIGKTIMDVDYDVDYEEKCEVLTLTFEDGTEAQISSVLVTTLNDRTDTELGFFIEGYKGVVTVPE